MSLGGGHGGRTQDACAPARTDMVVLRLCHEPGSRWINDLEPWLVSGMCAARDAGRRARDGVAGKNRVARPLLCRQSQRRGRSHGNQERGAGEHVHGVDPHLIRSQRGLRVVIPGWRWRGAIPRSSSHVPVSHQKITLNDPHAARRSHDVLSVCEVIAVAAWEDATPPVKGHEWGSPPIACSSRGGLCSSRLARCDGRMMPIDHATLGSAR